MGMDYGASTKDGMGCTGRCSWKTPGGEEVHDQERRRLAWGSISRRSTAAPPARRTRLHGQFPYRHGFYTDGFALDSKLLGYDAFGHLVGDGDGALPFHLRSSSSCGCAASSAQATITGWSTTPGNNIDISRPQPPRRGTAAAGRAENLSGPFHLYGEAGLDVKSNAGFGEGKSENDFAFQVRVVYAP